MTTDQDFIAAATTAEIRTERDRYRHKCELLEAEITELREIELRTALDELKRYKALCARQQETLGKVRAAAEEVERKHRELGLGAPSTLAGEVLEALA